METPNYQPPTKFLQFYHSVIVGLSGVVIGSTTVWNSVAVRLSATGSCGNDSDQAGWRRDGFFILGMAIGGLVLGQLARMIGYRLTVVLCDLFALVGWLVLLWSGSRSNYSPAASYGRLVQGLGTGGLGLIVPVYISHVTEFDVRGQIQMTHQVFVLLGVVIAYALGLFMSFNLMIAACCLLPLFHLFVTYICLSESPYYLYRLFYDAGTIKQTMCTIKGSEYNVDLDYCRLKKYMHVFEDRSNERSKKMWIIGLGLLVFQQLCGGNVLMFHMEETIIKFTSIDQRNGIVQIITLGIYSLQFLLCLTLVNVLDTVGRKFMLIFSALVMGLSLLALAVQHELASKDYNMMDQDTRYWYLSVLIILTYACSYSIGWGPVVMIVYTEIVHFGIWFSVVIYAIGLCALFAVAHMFFDPDALIGNTSMLWLYITSCLVSVPFVFFCVPETREFRLDHIQSMLVDDDDESETRPLHSVVTGR